MQKNWLWLSEVFKITISNDLRNIREFSDFWYHKMGVNIIPMNSKTKTPLVKWRKWQQDSIPLAQHEIWKNTGMYDNGIAVVTGKISRGDNQGRYLNCVDLDNRKGIIEFLTSTLSIFHANCLEDLSQVTTIEQHLDTESKAHVYFVTEIPLRKKGRLIVLSNNKYDNNIVDESIPAIEIKSDPSTLVTVSPSIHKNGYPYTIIGTHEPIVLNNINSAKIETMIEKIYENNSNDRNLVNLDPISKLPDDLKKIAKSLKIDYNSKPNKIIGGARNDTLFHFGLFIIKHHKNSKHTNMERLEDFFFKVNQEICSTSLPHKEVEIIWNQCTKYATGIVDKDDNDKEDKPRPEKNQILDMIEKKIELLFKDQFNEGFAKIFINDHYEIISIKSNRFKKLVQMTYYEDTNRIAGIESITNAVNILQAKAEFGDNQYHLSLRVASYDGSFYYDLTDSKHRCVKISQDGDWEVLDVTPVPLFKRYNQIPQDIRESNSEFTYDKENNPLEKFLSDLTNIDNKDTKLLVKVFLISYFIPDIPHVILLIHGSKGSAKSTFLRLIKEIVDPSRPALLTLHTNPLQFIQQLAHNYLASFDNIKFIPPWLPDEACRTITGTGQTKRELFTDDDDKVYEYKHCLNFNGINLAFSEPDVLDRSIIIELSEIEDDKRKTEQEILERFNESKPDILNFIFGIIRKAMTTKENLPPYKGPRMADSAEWGEAISQALGYENNEFIQAYHKNIGFQNNEVIDANPLAFALKCFIEIRLSLLKDEQIKQVKVDAYPLFTIFEGSPGELLEELDRIAIDQKINTMQKDWPKDRKWLVKRLRIVKSNLQNATGIKIDISRNSKNNSLIRIVKVNSGNSSIPILSPKNEKLSPFFRNITPDYNIVTSNKVESTSASDNIFGDTGDTGDKVQKSDLAGSNYDNNDDKVEQEKINELLKSEPKIGYIHPFFYCREHPKVKNIHFDEIRRHLQLSKDHGYEPGVDN